MDTAVTMGDALRSVIMAYTENFLMLVSTVETYGQVAFAEQKGITVVPQSFSPEYVTFSTLRRLVDRLADGEVPDFANRNTIPGAVFDGDELLNPEHIMPVGYDARALRADCTAVRSE